MTERSFPPYLPQDGRFSTEQYQGQGWQNKHLFFGHPPGERPYVELIGDPVEHPLLLDILRFWIDRLGMTVDCRMRRVALAEAGDYIERSCTDPLWRGAMVTGELRRAICSHVSLMAREGDDLPFVDTVFRWELGWPAGGIMAAGALWRTFEALLTGHEFPIWFAGIQIVGSGPEAYAAAGMFKEKQIENLWFYTADMEQGRDVARRLKMGEERVLPLAALGPLPAAAQLPFAAHTGAPHVLINTTDMGTAGAAPLPVNLDLYPDLTLVYDFVYEPRDSDLVARARKRGMIAANGLSLLVEQVAMAFWFFVLNNPPRKQDADLLERLA